MRAPPHQDLWQRPARWACRRRRRQEPQKHRPCAAGATSRWCRSRLRAVHLYLDRTAGDDRRASAAVANVRTLSPEEMIGTKRRASTPRHRTIVRMVQMPRKTVAAMLRAEASAGARAIPRTPTHASAHLRRSGASISGLPKLMSWRRHSPTAPQHGRDMAPISPST